MLAWRFPCQTCVLGEALRRDWLADPLGLDCAFQAIILWSFAQHGAAALPVFVGRYRQFRRAFPAGGVRLVARITKDTGCLARADVEFLDPATGRLVARLADAEVAIDAGLNEKYRRNLLTDPQAARV